MGLNVEHKSGKRLIQVSPNLHDSCVHNSGMVNKHFVISLIVLPLIFIEEYVIWLTLIPFTMAVYESYFFFFLFQANNLITF